MEPPNAAHVEDLRKLAYNTLLEEELLAILSTLTRHHIDAIVLKGLPLVARLGESLHTRRIADNDILVHAEDAARACAALADIGYHPPTIRKLETDLEADFQHPLVRTPARGAPFVVELHWNAFPLYLHVPASLLWENRELLRHRDTDMFVLNKELCLLHLASHYLQHLGLESRILDQLAHAYEIWRDGLDQERLDALMIATKTVDIVPYCLHLAWARQLLTRAPALPLTPHARSMLKWLPGPLEGEPYHTEAYRRSLLVWWFVAPRALLGLVLTNMFPPLSKMQLRHQETRRGRLFLFYLGRPLRPITRAAARFAKLRAARKAPLTPKPLR